MHSRFVYMQSLFICKEGATIGSRRKFEFEKSGNGAPTVAAGGALAGQRSAQEQDAQRSPRERGVCKRRDHAARRPLADWRAPPARFYAQNAIRRIGAPRAPRPAPRKGPSPAPRPARPASARAPAPRELHSPSPDRDAHALRRRADIL